MSIDIKIKNWSRTAQNNILTVLDQVIVLVFLLGPDLSYEQQLGHGLLDWDSNLSNSNFLQRFISFFSIYYNHRDTKLLLDILALNFGVAPCLKYLCIFDKNLQNTAKVEQLTANWQITGSEGKFDLVVEFKNSKAVIEIFSKIPGAACAYIVEITSPVEEVSTMSTSNSKNTAD